MNDAIRALIQALYQTVGNKGYMHSVEALLKTLELTPEQAEAIRYLARDLSQLDHDLSRAKRDAREPWRKGHF